MSLPTAKERAHALRLMLRTDTAKGLTSASERQDLVVATLKCYLSFVADSDDAVTQVVAMATGEGVLQQPSLLQHLAQVLGVPAHLVEAGARLAVANERRIEEGQEPAWGEHSLTVAELLKPLVEADDGYGDGSGSEHSGDQRAVKRGGGAVSAAAEDEASAQVSSRRGRHGRSVKLPARFSDSLVESKFTD